MPRAQAPDPFGHVEEVAVDFFSTKGLIPELDPPSSFQNIRRDGGVVYFFIPNYLLPSMRTLNSRKPGMEHTEDAVIHHALEFFLEAIQQPKDQVIDAGSIEAVHRVSTQKSSYKKVKRSQQQAEEQGLPAESFEVHTSFYYREADGSIMNSFIVQVETLVGEAGFDQMTDEERAALDEVIESYREIYRDGPHGEQFPSVGMVNVVEDPFCVGSARYNPSLHKMYHPKNVVGFLFSVQITDVTFFPELVVHGDAPRSVSQQIFSRQCRENITRMARLHTAINAKRFKQMSEHGPHRAPFSGGHDSPDLDRSVIWVPPFCSSSTAKDIKTIINRYRSVVSGGMLEELQPAIDIDRLPKAQIPIDPHEEYFPRHFLSWEDVSRLMELHGVCRYQRQGRVYTRNHETLFFTPLRAGVMHFNPKTLVTLQNAYLPSYIAMCKARKGIQSSGKVFSATYTDLFHLGEAGASEMIASLSVPSFMMQKGVMSTRYQFHEVLGCLARRNIECIKDRISSSLREIRRTPKDDPDHKIAEDRLKACLLEYEMLVGSILHDWWLQISDDKVCDSITACMKHLMALQDEKRPIGKFLPSFEGQDLVGDFMHSFMWLMNVSSDLASTQSQLLYMYIACCGVGTYSVHNFKGLFGVHPMVFSGPTAGKSFLVELLRSLLLDKTYTNWMSFSTKALYRMSPKEHDFTSGFNEESSAKRTGASSDVEDSEMLQVLKSLLSDFLASYTYPQKVKSTNGTETLENKRTDTMLRVSHASCTNSAASNENSKANKALMQRYKPLLPLGTFVEHNTVPRVWMTDYASAENADATRRIYQTIQALAMVVMCYMEMGIIRKPDRALMSECVLYMSKKRMLPSVPNSREVARMYTVYTTLLVLSAVQHLFFSRFSPLVLWREDPETGVLEPEAQPFHMSMIPLVEVYLVPSYTACAYAISSEVFQSIPVFVYLLCQMLLQIGFDPENIRWCVRAADQSICIMSRMNQVLSNPATPMPETQRRNILPLSGLRRIVECPELMCYYSSKGGGECELGVGEDVNSPVAKYDRNLRRLRRTEEELGSLSAAEVKARELLEEKKEELARKLNETGSLRVPLGNHDETVSNICAGLSSTVRYPPSTPDIFGDLAGRLAASGEKVSLVRYVFSNPKDHPIIPFALRKQSGDGSGTRWYFDPNYLMLRVEENFSIHNILQRIIGASYAGNTNSATNEASHFHSLGKSEMMTPQLKPMYLNSSFDGEVDSSAYPTSAYSLGKLYHPVNLEKAEKAMSPIMVKYDCNERCNLHPDYEDYMNRRSQADRKGVTDPKDVSASGKYVLINIHVLLMTPEALACYFLRSISGKTTPYREKIPLASTNPLCPNDLLHGTLVPTSFAGDNISSIMKPREETMRILKEMSVGQRGGLIHDYNFEKEEDHNAIYANEAAWRMGDDPETIASKKFMSYGLGGPEYGASNAEMIRRKSLENRTIPSLKLYPTSTVAGDKRHQSERIASLKK